MWSEAEFWACSWRGLMDAWTGYRGFVLGQDPDEAPLGRAEAAELDRAVAAWGRTGHWEDGGHG